MGTRLQPLTNVLTYQTNPFFTQWNNDYNTKTFQFAVQDQFDVNEDFSISVGFKGQSVKLDARAINPVPGPLALAWGFKAASTLDSMLGYRQGRLRWLGTAGARLDDLLVWLPCRLVALSLPLAAGTGPIGCLKLAAVALQDGNPDPSPNAGVSQAAYAHAAGVQLGGLNRYGDQLKAKPLLAAGCPPPNRPAVERMLRLSLRLEWIWLFTGLVAGGLIGIAS